MPKPSLQLLCDFNATLGGRMYYQSVLSDAPILYWRLSEPSGTTFADLSGFGRTGTKQGAPTMAITGPITPFEAADKALQTSQTASTGIAVTGLDNFPGNKATFEGFAYINTYPSAGNFQFIFGNKGSPGRTNNLLDICVANANVLRLRLGAHTFVSGAVLPAVTNWFHWAVTLDAESQTPLLYINGVNQTLTETVGGIPWRLSYYFEPNWFAGAYAASGLIPVYAFDEIAVYDTIVDGTAIADHYASRTNVSATVPSYTDLTTRLRESISITGYGRTDELGRVEPTKMNLTLDNKDRALEPENAASTYSPNVVPRRHFLLKAGENLIATNPQPETNTTGWGAKGAGSIALETTTFLIGKSSAKVTPASAALDGIMQSAGQSLTSGVQYTVNVYVSGPSGVGMTLAVMDSAGTTVQASTTFTGTGVGVWQRIGLSYTPGSTATRRVAVYRTGTGSAAQIFYVSGFQIVVGAEQAYLPSQITLFDGYNEDWLEDPQGATNGYVQVPCVGGLGVLQLPETGVRTYLQQKADARINRVLDMAGWLTSARSLETGVYDILAETSNSEKIAEHCLSVGEAENGLFFVARDGDATLFNANHKTTAARSTAAVATLSDWDTGSAGYYMYVDHQRDAAARWIYNDITLAKVSGTPFQSIDATSKNRYWRSSYEKTDLRLALDADVQTRLAALITRYKDFKVRPKTIVIKPTMHPGGWDLVCRAELWDRYNIDRHPQGVGSVTTIACFLEGMDITIPDTDNWTVVWGMSRV